MKFFQKIFILIIFTFIFSINSVAQKVFVSPVQTKILYEWIDNELEIMIENYSCKNIVAKVDKGKLIGKGCNYIYQSNGYGIREIKIIVGIKSAKGIKWFDSFSIRVKPLPEPWLTFGFIGNENSVNKTQLLYFLSNFKFPISFSGEIAGTNKNMKIDSFHLKIIRNDTIIYSEVHNLNDSTKLHKRFSDEDTSAFLYSDFTINAHNFIYNNCKKGDKIIFENLYALLYKKERRKLENFILIISN